jgi:hypothetical protein
MDKLNTSERAQDARLRRIYKKTLADKRREITDQGEGCAICGRPFPKFTANQDHFHGCCPRRLKEFCGKCNRGWLCFICNKFVMGYLERQKIDALKVWEYVQKWEQILRARGCYEPKEEKTKPRKK